MLLQAATSVGLHGLNGSPLLVGPLAELQHTEALLEKTEANLRTQH